MEKVKSENLILVFVKNILLGKVKTRLAKTKGDVYAFHVYKKLVDYTQQITEASENCDVRPYFSDVVIQNKWEQHQKFVQDGMNLGERMLNAFEQGFNDGYKRIIIVGSDCPELSTKIIETAFNALTKTDTVVGPAKDGGYYLLGMTKLHESLFKNKDWSTDQVLPATLADIKLLNLSVHELVMLSDIDTEEDLKNFPAFMPEN